MQKLSQSVKFPGFREQRFSGLVIAGCELHKPSDEIVQVTDNDHHALSNRRVPVSLSLHIETCVLRVAFPTTAEHPLRKNRTGRVTSRNPTGPAHKLAPKDKAQKLPAGVRRQSARNYVLRRLVCSARTLVAD